MDDGALCSMTSASPPPPNSFDRRTTVRICAAQLRVNAQLIVDCWWTQLVLPTRRGGRQTYNNDDINNNIKCIIHNVIVRVYFGIDKFAFYMSIMVLYRGSLVFNGRWLKSSSDDRQKNCANVSRNQNASI